MATIPSRVFDSVLAPKRAADRSEHEAERPATVVQMLREYEELATSNETLSAASAAERERIDAALRALPSLERAVLLLHRREHLTYQAIAGLMHISTADVRRALARALFAVCTSGEQREERAREPEQD